MGTLIVSVPATLAVAVVLAALVITAAAVMIRGRKRGKNCCGGDCRSCPSVGGCTDGSRGAAAPKERDG